MILGKPWPVVLSRQLVTIFFNFCVFFIIKSSENEYQKELKLLVKRSGFKPEENLLPNKLFSFLD